MEPKRDTETPDERTRKDANEREHGARARELPRSRPGDPPIEKRIAILQKIEAELRG